LNKEITLTHQQSLLIEQIKAIYVELYNSEPTLDEVISYGLNSALFDVKSIKRERLEKKLGVK